MANCPELSLSEATAHADPSPVGPVPVPDDTVREVPVDAVQEANDGAEPTESGAEKSDESEPLVGTEVSSSPANDELEPCPVSYDELIDGLFGALTWFSRAYETICERGEMELFTPQEYVLLRMIARYAENMRAAGPTELAKALGTSKGYVVDLSRALVAEGLVVKRRNKGDGRVRALDLTRRGEEIAATRSLGAYFWALLNAELGADAAHELAFALLLLRRQPAFY